MGTGLGCGLSTEDLGLGDKFRVWRPGQGEALDRLIEAFEQYRFACVSAPVGFGKTAVYVGLALAMGWRACFLTSSKGLQDQLMKDFGPLGMVDVRGRNNYLCGLAPDMTCEDGAQAGCQIGGCEYRASVKRATEAQLVTTNYKYWMLSHQFGEGLGEFDLLVLDEAHIADQEVTAAVRVEFTARKVYQLLGANFPDVTGDGFRGMEGWKEWARALLPRAVERWEGLKARAKNLKPIPVMMARDIHTLAGLVRDLGRLAAAEGHWAWEAIRTKEGTGWAIEPLWAKQHARELLFLEVPRVLLVSATIRPKTCELLGIGEAEVDFQEYPYVFPIHRSPIYFVPTVWVQHGMADGDRGLLESRIDRIIGDRLDRKGLIHTVSYELRDQLLEYCSTSALMLKHSRDSESVRKTIQQFKRMGPPVVLVSPSIATGYDFPYQDAEYQIIPKLPFPRVKGAAIMEARCHKRKGGDPDYANYMMVQALTQMFGRPMRAPDDRCETVILDNNFFWVQKKLRGYFPKWVWPLVRRVALPPDPPPALAVGIAA